MPTSTERNSPARPGLNEVHLYIIDLGVTRLEQVGTDDVTLSASERERAARFRSRLDAQRWTVTRCALRSILAGYLGTTPHEVAILLGPNGKPSVGDVGLHFNVSHTNGVALVAIDALQVGVDVERVRSGLDELSIAKRVFGLAESRALEAAAPEDRRALFFKLWVRHEAAAKCRGTGLEEQTRSNDDVLVEDVQLGSTHVAALAVARAPVVDHEDQVAPLRIRRLTEPTPYEQTSSLSGTD